MSILALVWLLSVPTSVFLAVSGLNGNWYYRDKRSVWANVISTGFGVGSLAMLLLVADTVWR